MNFLSVRRIYKQEGGHAVLENIEFEIPNTHKLGIAGETGSGKSTLLKIIAGLIQPDSGQVWIDGRRVLGPEEKLMPGHPKVAYLSQHFELPSYYTVENVLNYESKLSEEKTKQLYEICDIRHLLHCQTLLLSGGEKQRISLARVLLADPQLLLLDEPFSNADRNHKMILKKVIEDISEQMGITIILVSHDSLDLLSWADSILIMKEGKIIQQGTPHEIYYKPNNDYIAGLFDEFLVFTTNDLLHFPFLKLLLHQQSRIILRPQQFKISNEGEGSKARVLKKSFYGSYFLFEVLVGERKLLIPTFLKTIEVGDIIWITLSSDHI